MFVKGARNKICDYSIDIGSAAVMLIYFATRWGPLQIFQGEKLLFILLTGEFPAQMTSNAKNVSIWWRYIMQVITVYFTYEWDH